jgi:hypothetical protein
LSSTPGDKESGGLVEIRRCSSSHGQCQLSVWLATPEEAIVLAGGAEVTSSNDDMVLVYLVELDGG